MSLRSASMMLPDGATSGLTLGARSAGSDLRAGPEAAILATCQVVLCEMASRGGALANAADVLRDARFKSLVESYGLAEVSSGDLLSLDPDDLIDVVEPKHRVIMLLFIKALRKAQEVERDPYLKLEFGEDSKDRSQADESFAPRVRSKAVFNPLYRSVREWRDEIQKNGEEARRKIKTVTLRNQGLVDEDLEDIAGLVLLFPDCKRVDISGNRFRDTKKASETIGGLLQVDSVQVVDIRFTPLSTVDGAEFLKNLTSKQLRKLVWIPDAWLEGRNWSKLLGEEQEKIEAVLQAHSTFYGK